MHAAVFVTGKVHSFGTDSLAGAIGRAALEASVSADPMPGTGGAGARVALLAE